MDEFANYLHEENMNKYNFYINNCGFEEIKVLQKYVINNCN